MRASRCARRDAREPMEKLFRSVLCMHGLVQWLLAALVTASMTHVPDDMTYTKLPRERQIALDNFSSLFSFAHPGVYMYRMISCPVRRIAVQPRTCKPACKPMKLPRSQLYRNSHYMLMNVCMY